MMAMHNLMYVGSVLLAWFLWMFTSLVKNYWIARKIGLPMVISPATPLNPFWIICYRVFPQVLLLKHLPLGLGQWVRCTFMGWTFNDKYALHDELGDLFVVVSPGAIEVMVADPQTAHAVLARRKDYIKPAVMYEQLNVFGPNLNSVEGEDWQRHRRLTAPSFNEKTSSLVWDEASRQARDMVASWSRKGSDGTKDTVGDTATLALHVLTSAGFGVAYPFGQGVQSLSPGHAMTYRDSLSLCLQNIITFSIFPKKFLSLKFLPSKLRTLGKAAHEFQRYMEETLAHERSSASDCQSGSGNLASALVQASEDAKQSMVEGKKTKLGLSDDEIFGNIFAYNLAGHETTANTVATALVLLAAHPQYQDWLTEEIDSIVGTSREAWQYEKAFLSLHRCLAVMVSSRFDKIPRVRRLLYSQRSVRNTATLRLYSLHPQVHGLPPTGNHEQRTLIFLTTSDLRQHQCPSSTYESQKLGFRLPHLGPSSLDHKIGVN